ncbi:glutamate racemase [Embleya sp. NPDC050154]|uniref:glutamate racemase n=1 Tax=unclassified Embleya TaxID=2699296 RepID=UPI0037AC9FA1|nr:aspartate/glutamate racemase family protein [Embleya sp. NBC_00888]
MLVALIDSGMGLLPTAGWLRRLRPDLDLLLCTDPDHMPWGDRSEATITRRVLAAAELAAERGADGIVVPCNTATVTALDTLRARCEPAVPVVGTVPAIKPAAASGAPFAVWATVATTASAYQARLIEEFAAGRTVVRVACPGLAEAIDRADRPAVEAAIADAARRTPADCAGVVLGCTHYPLVTDRILAALPAGVGLYDSAEAVARQTLRRLGLTEDPDAVPGTIEVTLSGRPGTLPPNALAYPLGRALAEGSRPAPQGSTPVGPAARTQPA